jgi:T5SS/PEP-CTERM-associated repeat protein/autotransporter-associated beta strand protein
LALTPGGSFLRGMRDTRRPANRHRIFIFVSLATLSVVSAALAQNTINYTDGQIVAAPQTTTSTNPLTLSTSTGVSATQTGAITGNGHVTKSGAGTLTLVGDHTYTGFTFVDGTLLLGTGSSISASSTFRIGNAFNGSVRVSGGATVSNATETYVGNSATGALTIEGAGSSWSSEFLYIPTAGSVTVSDAGTLSMTTGLIGLYPNSTAQATVTGLGSSWNASRAIYVGYLSSGSLTVADQGTVTAGESVAVGAFNDASGQLTVTGANSSINAPTFNIGLSSTAVGIITLTDHGTLNATASNGADVINTGGDQGSAGTVNLGAASNAAAATAGILNVSAVRNGNGLGTLQFNTTGTALAPTYFTRDGTASGVGVNTLETSTGTLSVVHTAGYTVASGTFAHAGNTTVNGGTLVLTGDNTYAGNTILNGGNLVANNTVGSATGSGSVTVNSGAALGGSGFIGGLTTIESGATLAPGNSPGTLTFANGLTLANGSILEFELGTTSDLLRITGGTLTGSASAGGITLNLANSGGFTAATYTLFDFNGANLSSFDTSDFTFGTTLSGYTYALNLVGDTLQLTATASAIPEPSTYALLAGLATLGLAAWRRRARS